MRSVVAPFGAGALRAELRAGGLQALGDDPDIYEKLTASLAPSIWQLDDIKKGILCQLFGGCGKVSYCRVPRPIAQPQGRRGRASPPIAQPQGGRVGASHPTPAASALSTPQLNHTYTQH